jgi:uncharacterized membrane protein YecN with MAPEG domain
MRVHQNFFEYLPAILVFLLIGGLVFPKVAVVVGFVFAFFRFVYSYHYVKYGSDARKFGAVAGTAPALFLGVASLGSLVYNRLI